MQKRPLYNFCGYINKITTKADGGGRVELDFSGDALEAMQGLQRLHKRGEILIAFAAVPIYAGEAMPDWGANESECGSDRSQGSEAHGSDPSRDVPRDDSLSGGVHVDIDPSGNAGVSDREPEA